LLSALMLLITVELRVRFRSVGLYSAHTHTRCKLVCVRNIGLLYV